MNRILLAALVLLGSVSAAVAEPPAPTRTLSHRTVDLAIGETADVAMADGTKAAVKLLELHEAIDDLRAAVRQAKVKVAVNGQTIELVSGNYHLPRTVAGVQIDCPVTKGLLRNCTRDVWGLDKDARLRLWPEKSSLLESGTFVYPAKQRWFASLTQMANEPCYADGVAKPSLKKVYYHWGLDIGGAEGMVEIVAATNGLVVSAGLDVLPGYNGTPVEPRYDVVYILDDRGWYYRYSHLLLIDPAVKPGQKVKLGQKVGVLGKEGATGITGARSPSPSSISTAVPATSSMPTSQCRPPASFSCRSWWKSTSRPPKERSSSPTGSPCTTSTRCPAAASWPNTLSACANFSLRDSVRLMIAFSDHTARKMVLDKIGITPINQRMQAWGLRNTKLYSRRSREDTDAMKQFGLGSTTAREMVMLLEYLNTGTHFPPAMKQAVLGHLRHCEDRDHFPRFLPGGTILAHTTGATERVRNDAGIVFLAESAVAICVLTADNEDTRGDAVNVSTLLCAKVAKEICAYFRKRE